MVSPSPCEFPTHQLNYPFSSSCSPSQLSIFPLWVLIFSPYLSFTIAVPQPHSLCLTPTPPSAPVSQNSFSRIPSLCVLCLISTQVCTLKMLFSGQEASECNLLNWNVMVRQHTWRTFELMDNLPHLTVIDFTFIKPSLLALSSSHTFLYFSFSPIFLRLDCPCAESPTESPSLCPTCCTFSVTLAFPFSLFRSPLSSLRLEMSTLVPAASGVNGKIMVTASYKSTQLKNIAIRVSSSFPPSSVLIVPFTFVPGGKKGEKDHY